MSKFNFKDMLIIGKEAEEKVAKVLSQTGEVTEATIDAQKRGIDLFYCDAETREVTTYEVKNDNASLKTGNFFIETSQNDKLGWLYYTEADVLVLVSGNIAYFLNFVEFKFHVLSQKYRCVYGGNNSAGFLVPVSIIARKAFKSQEL